MALPGLIDIYEVQQELGTGGMATVYRAVATADRPELGIRKGDAVAIKLLHAHLAKIPEFPQRFAREVRVAAKLVHAGVARVYHDGLTADRQPYLVMELAEGRKLGEYLSRDKPFDTPRILSVLRQVAAVLEEARRHGVVHRDIKPDNLLLDEQGRVKVLDFGLVRDQDTLVMIS
ncbi:serine/threonine protein kinase [bacterium]|nr:serine/threonine protein kinase [bacterium]